MRQNVYSIPGGVKAKLCAILGGPVTALFGRLKLKLKFRFDLVEFSA